MCGFLLEFKSDTLSAKEEFIKLLSQSKLRGPDYQGYWSNNISVQLGFNRLSILDLSEAGNQPMISPSQKFAIVFNGEIYNHADLRNLLNASQLGVAAQPWRCRISAFSGHGPVMHSTELHDDAVAADAEQLAGGMPGQLQRKNEKTENYFFFTKTKGIDKSGFFYTMTKCT